MGRKLGLVTVQILNALVAGESFGFAIMRRTGLPSGTVYPTLARLERTGLVESRWEGEDEAGEEARPRRRYFELTGKGQAALSESLERMRVLTKSLPGLRLRPEEG